MKALRTALTIALTALSLAAFPYAARANWLTDVFALPTAPKLTPMAESLVLDFEVSGEAAYKRYPYPTYGGGAWSGATWGIGYDATAQSAEKIRSDWQKLGEINAARLAATHPYRGNAARAQVKKIRDILVEWSLALDVFDRIDVARQYQLAKRFIPNFDELRPNAQSALLVCGFNRGWSTIGRSRIDIYRIVHIYAPRSDYNGMARCILHMNVTMRQVWTSQGIYDGLARRNIATAKLMETP